MNSRADSGLARSTAFVVAALPADLAYSRARLNDVLAVCSSDFNRRQEREKKLLATSLGVFTFDHYAASAER